MPTLSQASSITRLLGLLQLAQERPTSFPEYKVYFANLTPTVLDEVVIFYKVRNQNGVVFLNKIGLVPGEVAIFELGACILMESYVVGVFIDGDLVAQLPAAGDGNMTPERASQFNPEDVNPCVDEWRLEVSA